MLKRNNYSSYLQERARKDQSFTYEVIIVDDGSSDGTKRVAFDFVRKYKADNVRVVLLKKNQGKGEAIRKGMLHSRGKLLLMLDADGATKVDDLEKLENQILAVAKTKHQSAGDSREGIADIPIVAFGSRAHIEKKALATRKWYRNFLMKGFHVVVLLVAGPGVRDTQCGFKMFTRAAARKLFTNQSISRPPLLSVCQGLPDDKTTRILTDVTGTTGYLDLEYRRSHNLNEKSDVYRFGIVLLELITGPTAIIKSMDHIHIMQYMGPYIEKGDITSVIDEQMVGDYTLDSVWKAMEVSVACTRAMSTHTVTMGEVLTGLKYCLEMEMANGPKNRVNHGTRKMVGMRMDHSPEVCSMDFEFMTGPSGRW